MKGRRQPGRKSDVFLCFFDLCHADDVSFKISLIFPVRKKEKSAKGVKLGLSKVKIICVNSKWCHFMNISLFRIVKVYT